jgi:subtilisin family serine protease
MRVLFGLLALACASATIQKAFNGELIDGEYIVVFHSNVTDAQVAAHMASPTLAGAQIMFEYSVTLKGYAVKHDEATMVKLSEDPIVAWVEQNQIARAIESEAACAADPRPQHWGLQRVSTDANTGGPLRRDNRLGQGVDVYIIDTGIYTEHSDFGGRASFGFDCTNEGPGDGNGHGTHCASSAAGTQHGVASNAALIAVKVLNRGGSGTFACVIRGIEFVGGRPGARRVGSMSLGGGYSAAVNTAVNGAVSRGAAMVSASGNSNTNACNFSPASSEDGITVNSIQTGDARSGFSNFGTCTHIFAPGTNILGAWIGGQSATRTISGTSMACPHVTGIIAEFWAQPEYASQNGRAIQNTVANAGATGRVTNPGNGSPNRLAQTSCAQ